MNPHAAQSALPHKMIASLYHNRSLIWQMTKRDVIGRYKGSLLGILWSFINPLIMLLVYTFVFGVVLKAKWNLDTTQNFAIVLFVGLVIHGLLSECLIRSPTLIVGNVNYVKKVVFPLESLALVQGLSALIHFMISLIILFFAQLILSGSIQWTWVFLPLIIVPLLLVCLGASWLLSSLGVYLRDIGQMMQIVSTILLFVSPIFLPIDAFPDKYQFLISLNPLTIIVNEGRQILILGSKPDFYKLGIYTAGAALFVQFSYWWFIRTKKGFADVL